MNTVNVAFYDYETGKIIMIGQGSRESMILDELPFVYLPDDSLMWDRTHKVSIIDGVETLVLIDSE